MVSEPMYREEIEGATILYQALPDLRRLYVEVTSRCDAGCIMCIRRTWNEAKGDLNFELFQKLMEEVPQFPLLKWVYLGGFGEPLLHPQILDMIKCARKTGLRIKISSNGQYLQLLAEDLVRLGVEEIIVSCDSTSEKGFEKIRGNSFRQLEKGIYALNRAKKKYESIFPRLVLEFVAMKCNIHELKELPRLASRWEALSLLVTNLLPYSQDMEGEILYIHPNINPTDKIAVDIASIVWEAAAKKWFTWGTIKLPRMAWGAARQCRFVNSYSAVVTWDGDVVPCYPLSHSYTYFVFDRRKEVKRYSFGNLKNSSLYSIWTSKEYVRFRGKVRLFRFPSCVDCELAYTCDYPANNCDCWGNEPSCADCLWAQNIIQCP